MDRPDADEDACRVRVVRADGMQEKVLGSLVKPEHNVQIVFPALAKGDGVCACEAGRGGRVSGLEIAPFGARLEDISIASHHYINGGPVETGEAKTATTHRARTVTTHPSAHYQHPLALSLTIEMVLYRFPSAMRFTA